MLDRPLVDRESTLEEALKLGLSEEEYKLIHEKIERTPTFTELAMFSGMWSEHCSYKNSILLLKDLYSESDLLLAERGEENAGALRINDKQAVVFKIESHNHPSAIEPYQGAATGVGGIMRDIFTMGARPLLSLNSLRFGSPDQDRNKYLLKEVVKGIGDYGNSLGIPCAGGELYFHDSFSRNPLVNAMTVGIADIEHIASSRASGYGNYVLYVGAKTGRDGIHGASFASKDLSDESEEERSAVQVGDPFLEKIVMEATLECIHKKLLIAVQDMGAAGLLSSSSEMSSSGGVGIDLFLDQIPAREDHMEPFEYLLSESQERMLMVIEPEKLKEVKHVFDKWELECQQVGTITDTRRLRIFFNNDKYADLPVDSLTVNKDGAPRYRRETKAPTIKKVTSTCPREIAAIIQNGDSSKFESLVSKILSSPNFASRRPVYEQYDTDIGNMRIVGPGQNSGVYQIPGTDQAIAAVTDGNSYFVSIDPYAGASHTVAESYRNLVSSGAKPIGVTNCLNFANPHKPENFYTFENSVKGMSDTSEKFKLPVTGGNVSFYNESEDGPVLPTPTIGMVGLLDHYSEAKTTALRPDCTLYLVGHFMPDLETSQYAYLQYDHCGTELPKLDISQEMKTGETILIANKKKSIDSLIDVSSGGVLIALLNMIFSGKQEGFSSLGFEFNQLSSLLSDGLSIDDVDLFLFGESAHSYLVSVENQKKDDFETTMKSFGTPHFLLGTSNTSAKLTFNSDVNLSVDVLYEVWDTALEKYLH